MARGTARRRGQTPEAAARTIPKKFVRHWTNPATMKLAAGRRRETARGREASNDERRNSPAVEMNTAKGMTRIPGALPNPTQNAGSAKPRERPGGVRYVRRRRDRPRMTRAGRRLQSAKLKATETRGAKNRKDASRPRLGRQGRQPNVVAGWFAGWSPADGTARPTNAEGNAENAKPHERRPADLSAPMAPAANRWGRCDDRVRR